MAQFGKADASTSKMTSNNSAGFNNVLVRSWKQDTTGQYVHLGIAKIQVWPNKFTATPSCRPLLLKTGARTIYVCGLTPNETISVGYYVRFTFYASTINGGDTFHTHLGLNIPDDSPVPVASYATSSTATRQTDLAPECVLKRKQENMAGPQIICKLTSVMSSGTHYKFLFPELVNPINTYSLKYDVETLSIAGSGAEQLYQGTYGISDFTFTSGGADGSVPTCHASSVPNIITNMVSTSVDTKTDFRFWFTYGSGISIDRTFLLIKFETNDITRTEKFRRIEDTTNGAPSIDSEQSNTYDNYDALFYKQLYHWP
jgi:hypothetical protein